MILLLIVAVYLICLYFYEGVIKPAQDKKIDEKRARQKEERGF